MNRDWELFRRQLDAHERRLRKSSDRVSESQSTSRRRRRRPRQGPLDRYLELEAMNKEIDERHRQKGFWETLFGG